MWFQARRLHGVVACDRRVHRAAFVVLMIERCGGEIQVLERENG